MVEIYVSLINKGLRTLQSVPKQIRAEVKKALEAQAAEEPLVEGE